MNEQSGLEPQAPQDVHVDTMNGRQELVVPGRFDISWAPEAVDALPPDQVTEFQITLANFMNRMRGEISGDENVRNDAISHRADSMIEFATLARIPGVSIAYNDRNTRYTSMDGQHFMPEEIVPGKPMDEPQPLGGIPNPLNAPELRQ